MKRTAAVIGAGIGGIATAIHLARRGMRVTVIEKNARPGGRCDVVTRAGHRFDTGPTLLIMPRIYEEEFAALGASFHERLDLQRVDPTYHLVFDDGSRMALTSDMEAMCAQLEGIEPGSVDGFLRYMREGRRHYEVAMARLVQRNFRRAREFFRLGNLPLLLQLQPLTPHYRHMGSFFRSPRLQSAFTFQDVYMGLSPFEAPATFSMMPYTELAHGVWYPKGGMGSVVKALVEMAEEAGVEFVFGTSVERIEVTGGRARGLRLEGDGQMAADVVVANADLPYVYERLLPDAELAKRLKRKRYSCSTISFFWGVDKAYPELPPHTLFLADDYRENFRRIRRCEPLPEKPSVYVHAPVRLDPTAAPAGEETLIGIVPVGHLASEDARENAEQMAALRVQARAALLERLSLVGIRDLEAHLKFEMVFTPQSWQQRYNLAKGSTHGLAHTLTQLGYLRPHNRHPRYGNVYFVGASTHPGTGVPTALVSGRLAAERIVDEVA